jgi:hypothetical protein
MKEIHVSHLNDWNDKYGVSRPRRLLALDGGGIRGIISLEILRKIEIQLAALTGEGRAFRLGNYFGYIGGMSTGAIIAGLAVGKTVEELMNFYISAGSLMFEKATMRAGATGARNRTATTETKKAAQRFTGSTPERSSPVLPVPPVQPAPTHPSPSA